MKDTRGLWATRAKVSKENETQGGTIPKGAYRGLGITTAYATMQPMPGLGFPSASIGVERMGSDSGALEVKRVAKESIGVWVGG